jgi:hypothetical protein
MLNGITTLYSYQPSPPAFQLTIDTPAHTKKAAPLQDGLLFSGWCDFVYQLITKCNTSCPLAYLMLSKYIPGVAFI